MLYTFQIKTAAGLIYTLRDLNIENFDTNLNNQAYISALLQDAIDRGIQPDPVEEAIGNTSGKYIICVVSVLLNKVKILF